MLDEIELKTVHKEGDWYKKKKKDTAWSKASQKHKWQSADFSKDKSVQKTVLISSKLQNHAFE